MQLRWPAAEAEAVRPWALPGGEVLHAALPRRFGLLIRRQAEDAYALSLVWDSACKQWFSLRRHEIAGSALGGVLAALGTSLDYLLDQPVGAADQTLTSAA
jgi:hypothetical protein